MRTILANPARIALCASFLLLTFCANSFAQSPDPATPPDVGGSQEPSTQEDLNRQLDNQVGDHERVHTLPEYRDEAEADDAYEGDDESASNDEDAENNATAEGEARADETSEVHEADASAAKPEPVAVAKPAKHGKVAGAAPVVPEDPPAEAPGHAIRARGVVIAALLASLAAILAMLQRHLKTMRAEDALLD